MRHAVIDKKNFVVNVIIYKPGSTWTPPYECTIVPSEIANIGDWYDTESGTFFSPTTLDT